MKLISAIEYSDYLQASTRFDSVKWELFRLFAKFLSQKLELWMFVPCKLVEGVWVVLKEPNRKNFYIIGFEKVMKEYQEAKDRVLFGGFAYDKMGFAYSTIQKECGFDEEYMENKTIEDLVKYNLELTPTAKKQIGL